jgi:hypothetical protein
LRRTARPRPSRDPRQLSELWRAVGFLPGGPVESPSHLRVGGRNGDYAQFGVAHSPPGCRVSTAGMGEYEGGVTRAASTASSFSDETSRSQGFRQAGHAWNATGRGRHQSRVRGGIDHRNPALQYHPSLSDEPSPPLPRSPTRAIPTPRHVRLAPNPAPVPGSLGG